MLFEIFSVVTMASAASAHIVMASPAPFAGTGQPPLDASGSNFPCQGVSYDRSGATDMPAGSSQSMSFLGTAVHGGGSCQISLTQDTAPTADSVFKVIQSYEGGCPARVNNDQNLPGNSASLPGVDQYPYTIPADLEDGDYTLAWTWVNKIGNREFYMNCAPITVGGGSAKRDISKRAFDALPDLFTANIGGGCTTSEGVDIQYPNPGTLAFGIENNPDLGPPTGSCGTGGGTGGGVTPAPEQPVAPTPEQPVAPTPEQPVAPTPEQPVAPTPEQPITPTPEQPVAPVDPAPGAGGQQTVGAVCLEEGAYACATDSFQRCASGQWSASIPLASGMTCGAGVGPMLNMNSKRSSSNMRRGLRIKQQVYA